MAEKDSVVVRLVFTDPAYAPSAQGMDTMVRLCNDIFKEGGILVIPAQITMQWVKDKAKEAMLDRQKDGKSLDFTILNAVKAIEIQHIRVDFE